MKNLQLPIRLENAITKLYNAFHKGELNAMDCGHCAVGNLCDNNHYWLTSRMIDFGKIGRISNLDNKTGYNRKELATIECLFIYGVKKYNRIFLFNNNIDALDIKQNPSLKPLQRELQFKGLCAVVEYLCELDNIPNVMDIQSLFEYENDAPKKQLAEIL